MGGCAGRGLCARFAGRLGRAAGGHGQAGAEEVAGDVGRLVRLVEDREVERRQHEVLVGRVRGRGLADDLRPRDDETARRLPEETLIERAPLPFLFSSCRAVLLSSLVSLLHWRFSKVPSVVNIMVA